VTAARRGGKLDAFIAGQTAGKRPGDIVPLIPKIKAAIEAAFDPAGPAGSSSSDEKKSPSAPAGGSTS